MGAHIPQSSASSRRTRRRLLPLVLALVAASATTITASPYPKGDILHDARYAYLVGRTCDSFCGDSGQYCCGGNERCTTLPNNVATCLVSGAVASPLYTTTWTETRTYTSTVLTWFVPPPAPTAGVACVPQRPEWAACGEICCAGWQTCAYQGQCSAKPGYGEPTTVIVTSNGVVTTQYSAPFRVTGTTTITGTGIRTTDGAGVVTGTATATSSSHTATGTQDPDGAAGGEPGTANNKLSGGAIAGIVIGSLAAAGLLILLCFCCIARGLFHALFGKKREKADQYDNHSASGNTRRDRHSGWFGGGRPSSVSDRRSEKKSSSGAWWLGIASGAATLLALLNMKKKNKKEPSRKGTSRYTDSYYSYSDYSGITPSSASSGRRGPRTARTARTAPTARSGRSRTSRDSRSRMDSRSRLDSRSRIDSRVGMPRSAYTGRSASQHD